MLTVMNRIEGAPLSLDFFSCKRKKINNESQVSHLGPAHTMGSTQSLFSSAALKRLLRQTGVARAPVPPFEAAYLSGVLVQGQIDRM